MTDDEINKAMADAMGWRKEDGVYVWTANGIDCTCDELWDWANDLNAMYLAERFLWCRDYTLRQRFIAKLAVMLNKSEWRKMEAVDMLDLTARERAEAFLRTLGKWEEVQP